MTGQQEMGLAWAGGLRLGQVGACLKAPQLLLMNIAAVFAIMHFTALLYVFSL